MIPPKNPFTIHTHNFADWGEVGFAHNHFVSLKAFISKQPVDPNDLWVFDDPADLPTPARQDEIKALVEDHFTSTLKRNP